MLPISKEVLLDELEAAQRYLTKWIDKSKAGIPGYDLAATGLSGPEESAELFIRELCSELRIVAGKCELLSEVVLEGFLQSS